MTISRLYFQKGNMKLSDLIPKPDILTCKRLLCAQAHPDDMDVFAGGTIACLTENGAEVNYLTVTDGSAGFLSTEVSAQERKNKRKSEQENDKCK